MTAGIKSGALGVRKSAFGRRRLKRVARKCGSWLALTAALALTMSRSAIGARAKETRPAPGAPDVGVTIRVYNYSEASAWTLERAEREAGHIVAKTGITAIWLDCRKPADDLRLTAGQSCEGAMSGARLVLRILPGSARPGSAFGDMTSGYAIGNFLATVFYGRVEELMHYLDGDQREAPVILGYVIAHELGHVLLGTNSHSTKGIMSAKWGPGFLRQALRGEEPFLPEQSALIRATVRRRHEEITQP